MAASKAQTLRTWLHDREYIIFSNLRGSVPVPGSAVPTFLVRILPCYFVLRNSGGPCFRLSEKRWRIFKPREISRHHSGERVKRAVTAMLRPVLVRCFPRRTALTAASMPISPRRRPSNDWQQAWPDRLRPIACGLDPAQTSTGLSSSLADVNTTSSPTLAAVASWPSLNSGVSRRSPESSIVLPAAVKDKSRSFSARAHRWLLDLFTAPSNPRFRTALCALSRFKDSPFRFVDFKSGS